MSKQHRCSRKTKSAKCSHIRRKTKQRTSRKKSKTIVKRRSVRRKKSKTTNKRRSVRRKSPLVHRQIASALQISPERDFTEKMGVNVENKQMCCQGSNHSGDDMQAALNTLCFNNDATPTQEEISKHYDRCIVQVDPEVNRTDPRAKEFAQNVNAARYMLDSRPRRQ